MKVKNLIFVMSICFIIGALSIMIINTQFTHLKIDNENGNCNKTLHEEIINLTNSDKLVIRWTALCQGTEIGKMCYETKEVLEK